MNADASRFGGQKISAGLLSVWARECTKATTADHVCWIQLAEMGLEITMIGPTGDRAVLPIRYDELADAQSSLSPDTISEMIRVLRFNLKLPSVIPKGLIVPSSFRGRA